MQKSFDWMVVSECHQSNLQKQRNFLIESLAAW